ncbi:MAG TPA: hypothetical protein VH158_04550 [Gemmatimonadales bacterium]|jgi:hypothetical protein|nr:hypothetical protein [Gemmatimonadales bacterium]
MKRIALATALVVALAAAPVAAQTRLNVWFGVGDPAPYGSGIVVVRPRYPYYRDRESYREHDRYFYREPRVERRGYWMRRHRWHRDYDRE